MKNGHSHSRNGPIKSRWGLFVKSHVFVIGWCNDVRPYIVLLLNVTDFITYFYIGLMFPGAAIIGGTGDTSPNILVGGTQR